MSIQNFPKIPKISLKKPCDQAKDTKNKKYSFSLFNGFSMIMVYFYVVQPLTFYIIFRFSKNFQNFPKHIFEGYFFISKKYQKLFRTHRSIQHFSKIPKSYLENHATKLKIRKIQIPNF